MVGGGHQLHQEGFAAGGIAVHLLQRIVIQMFVGHPPDIAEGAVPFRELAAVEGLIMVAAEIGGHVVEARIAAVHEAIHIAVLGQHGAQRFQVLIVVAPDHRVSRKRRDRQRGGFQTTHRTVSGGAQVGEEQALCRQAV